MNWPQETIYLIRLRYWYRNIFANRLLLFFTVMMRKIIIPFFLLGIAILFNACQKEYSVENGKVTFNAVGSLKDSSGNCMPAAVFGTFYNGVTPGSDTAYVELKVNVDSIGSYTITTDLQNGFMFADSGYFSTTGTNTIKLKPIGTPILQKPTFFTVSFDTSICSFTVNVLDSSGTGGGTGGGIDDTTNYSDSAWRFRDSATTYNGFFDQAFVIDTLGGTYMVLTGYTAANGDSAFVLSIPTVGGVITPGTYTTATTSVFYLADLTTGPPFPFIFSANFLTAPDFLTINIVSYNSTTRIVTGNFSGTAKDALGNSITISEGSFKAYISP